MHPESPEAVVAQADVVGSTSQLIAAAQTLDATNSSSPPTTASCTRCSMAAPGKRFIDAPTAGNSATCKSCAHCPWMAMNGLQNLADVLESGSNEIHVDPEIGRKAYVCIDRMLDFAAQQKANVRPSGDLAQRTKTVYRNRPGMSTLQNPFAPFDAALAAAFEANINGGVGRRCRQRRRDRQAGAGKRDGSRRA